MARSIIDQIAGTWPSCTCRGRFAPDCGPKCMHCKSQIPIIADPVACLHNQVFSPSMEFVCSATHVSRTECVPRSNRRLNKGCNAIAYQYRLVRLYGGPSIGRGLRNVKLGDLSNTAHDLHLSDGHLFFIKNNGSVEETGLDT